MAAAFEACDPTTVSQATDDATTRRPPTRCAPCAGCCASVPTAGSASWGRGEHRMSIDMYASRSPDDVVLTPEDEAVFAQLEVHVHEWVAPARSAPEGTSSWSTRSPGWYLDTGGSRPTRSFAWPRPSRRGMPRTSRARAPKTPTRRPQTRCAGCVRCSASAPTAASGSAGCSKRRRACGPRHLPVTDPVRDITLTPRGRDRPERPPPSGSGEWSDRGSFRGKVWPGRGRHGRRQANLGEGVDSSGRGGPAWRPRLRPATRPRSRELSDGGPLRPVRAPDECARPAPLPSLRLCADRGIGLVGVVGGERASRGARRPSHVLFGRELHDLRAADLDSLTTFVFQQLYNRLQWTLPEADARRAADAGRPPRGRRTAAVVPCAHAAGGV